MAWYYAVAERDHDIQNPTSAEKIRLLEGASAPDVKREKKATRTSRKRL